MSIYSPVTLPHCYYMSVFFHFLFSSSCFFLFICTLSLVFPFFLFMFSLKASSLYLSPFPSLSLSFSFFLSSPSGSSLYLHFSFFLLFSLSSTVLQVIIFCSLTRPGSSYFLPSVPSVKTKYSAQNFFPLLRSEKIQFPSLFLFLVSLLFSHV